MKWIFSAALLCVFCAHGQSFTKKDSLQGGMRQERSSYDVLHYDLDVTFDKDIYVLHGSNRIRFKMVEDSQRIQLDLFPNMQVDSIIFRNKSLNYKREEGAVFIDLGEKLPKNTIDSLRFYYSGKPQMARNAPWDGGMVHRRTKKGEPIVGVAVQGTGASLWYPVKDVQWDEPDQGATISLTVPNGLIGISNGKLLGSQPKGSDKTTWSWEVKNPINNYNITFYVGPYEFFSDTHNNLELQYYVLKGNLDKAKKQFSQVHTLLDCFEEHFGPYPFPEDGFKLVESSYLGMEHQSAIAYGNRYMNGYRGSDLSGTGHGLSFDYIIVHESGHEWFGNSITAKDIADMWIHEGFTMYSEAVYLECTQGKKVAYEYMNGIRKNIRNDRPIQGNFGVNQEGSGDMYPKGAWMLFTIRNCMADDAKWKELLRSFCLKYKHQTIGYDEVVTHFNEKSGMDLTKIFEQYVKTRDIPVLKFEQVGQKLTYQWDKIISGFTMPIDITINGKMQRIWPTIYPQSLKTDKKNVKVLQDHFLIDVSGLD